MTSNAAVAELKKFHNKAISMSHTITLSRPLYSPIQELNYACHKNKNYAFRFDNLWDRYDFLLSNNLVTREQCTPSFMIHCLDLFNSGWCLKHFLNILGEEQIPEHIKIYAMQKDTWGNALGLLRHPSDKVIETALQSAGQLIKYVKNPTEHQKLLAVQYSTETPDLITKIEKPTIQMQKIHVSRYLDGIDYIKNPSESVKIAAVKAHGTEVLKQKNMRNASEQVLLIAIEHTYCTELQVFLRYISHPNHKILCAIRHQINITKDCHTNTTTNTEQNSCESELQSLRRILIASGHIEQVVQIGNKYYRDEQALIQALRTLYEQTRNNELMLLMGEKTM